MLLEVVIGNGDVSGAHDGVNQPIRPPGQVAMVHPDVVGSEDAHCIAIGSPSITGVRTIASNHSWACCLEVVNVHTMDDHVGDILESQTSSGVVDVEPSAVDGLEAGHDELILEPDVHVPCEGDPHRPLQQLIKGCTPIKQVT